MTTRIQLIADKMCGYINYRIASCAGSASYWSKVKKILLEITVQGKQPSAREMIFINKTIGAIHTNGHEYSYVDWLEN